MVSAAWTLSLALVVTVAVPNESGDSEKVVALKKERLAVAVTVYNAREEEFLAGRGTLEFLLTSSRNWLIAQLELTDVRDERLKAYADHWERLHKIEKVNKSRFEAGRISIHDYETSRYHRLEAEIWLEQARAKKDRFK